MEGVVWTVTTGDILGVAFWVVVIVLFLVCSAFLRVSEWWDGRRRKSD